MPISNGPFSSISGPNLTLWRLKGLKNKVSVNNFVANLPNVSAVAADGINGQNVLADTANNSWSVNDYNNVRLEYQKLANVVNELKVLLDALEIK